MRTKFMLRVWSVFLVTTLLNTTFGLSTSAPVPHLPLKGTLLGHETDIFQPPASIAVQGTGHGNATLLGRFSVEYRVLVNLETRSGPAEARLIAANGEVIQLRGSGDAHDTETPGVVRIDETFSITGGTGRFENATGEVKVTRFVDVVAGDTFGTLDGTIALQR